MQVHKLLTMFQPNPNANKWVLPDGYKDLGWQLIPENSPEMSECITLRHKKREFDNSRYKNRGTDIITICDECKIVWHIDMSD